MKRNKVHVYVETETEDRIRFRVLPPAEKCREHSQANAVPQRNFDKSLILIAAHLRSCRPPFHSSGTYLPHQKRSVWMHRSSL